MLLLRWSALPLCCAAFLGLIMVTTDLRSSLPDHSARELEPQCVWLLPPNKIVSDKTDAKAHFGPRTPAV